MGNSFEIPTQKNATYTPPNSKCHHVTMSHIHLVLVFDIHQTTAEQAIASTRSQPATNNNQHIQQPTTEAS
jgi:hypothetical protein